MNPGSNLFLRALRLIKPMAVQYYAYASRTQNAARQWVPTFAAPVSLMASVQAVPRTAYKALGLDFQKNYIKIFVAENAINLARDTSGDRFVVNSRAYQLSDQSSWFFVDGWVGCTAVDVGPSSGTLF